MHMLLFKPFSMDISLDLKERLPGLDEKKNLSDLSGFARAWFKLSVDLYLNDLPYKSFFNLIFHYTLEEQVLNFGYLYTGKENSPSV